MLGETVKFLSYGDGRIPVGGVYPTRRNQHNELIFVTSGLLFVCQDYNEYRLTTGDALLLDGGRRRYGSRECTEETAFRRIVFDCELTDDGSFASIHSCFTPAHPERFSELLDLIRLYSSLPEYPDESLNLLIRLTVNELYIDGVPRDEDARDKLALCSALALYIREQGGAVKTSELAVKFGYSSKYLSELFLTYYSRGLKSYTDAVRLAQIKLLLGSDLTVALASERAGFASPKQMQDFFRYNTGMTVNEWLATN